MTGKIKNYEIQNAENLSESDNEALEKGLGIYRKCERLGLGYSITEHYGTINYHFNTWILQIETIPAYIRPQLIPEVMEKHRSTLIFVTEKSENLRKWFERLNPVNVDTNWYYFNM